MQYEMERWLRTLEYIKAENTLLKHRLAETVHLKADKHLLNQAEDFQNYFLNNDAVITMLKTDILKHEQLLAKGMQDEASFKKIEKGHQILRGDMEKMEKNFSKFNLDFNTYIDDTTTGQQLVG